MEAKERLMISNGFYPNSDRCLWRTWRGRVEMGMAAVHGYTYRELSEVLREMSRGLIAKGLATVESRETWKNELVEEAVSIQSRKKSIGEKDD